MAKPRNFPKAQKKKLTVEPVSLSLIYQLNFHLKSAHPIYDH